MDNNQKLKIQRLLQAKVDAAKAKGNSQKKFLDSLTGVSESMGIQILKGNWSSISDSMWLKVAKQVGLGASGQWQMAETRPFNALVKLLGNAQEHAMVQAIALPAGRGKSAAIKWFKEYRENVFHIVCTPYMSGKEVLGKILRAMGKEPIGTTSNCMDLIIETVLKLKDPIIILDEFDKLKDGQKLFFITLFNMLEDQCALVLLGTLNMELQIRRKTGRHAIGFEEIYSRINRKFVTLPDCNLKDITAICEANGLTDTERIHSIYNECEGDLRRVRTAIRIAKLQELKQAA
jgi:hypothetical protein